MKTILLGSSGFLGPQILSRYPEIVSVGRTIPPIKNVQHVYCPSVDAMPSVLDKMEFDNVIMMIGSSNHVTLNQEIPLNIEAIEKNAIPLYKIFTYFRERKIKKLISFSSILLYDRNVMILPVAEDTKLNPYQNQYIFSKHLGEEVARFFSDVPNIIVRLTNIYGPTTALGRPDLVNELIEGLLFKGNAKVKTGKPQRDFVFTEDASDAIVSLLNTSYTGPVNVASGTMSSVLNIVKILEDVSKTKIEVGNGEHTGHLQFQADISLLNKLTGFQPKYDLHSGLEKTYFKMKEMYNV